MRHQTLRLVVIGWIWLLAGSCAGERENVSSWKAGIASELDAAYATFREGYRLADAATVAGLYADSAFYLQPGHDIIRGRDTILAGFDRFLGPVADAGEPGPDIRFDIVDRDISGDLAYDIGYYTLNGSDRGKFIVIWKRDSDGRWRMYADGYSEVPSRPTQ